MSKQKPKVLVAMSGGVDSSVAAALLKEQGYDVAGVFGVFQKRLTSIVVDSRLRGNDNRSEVDNKCCSIEAQEIAQAVANKLQIPFYVMDFSGEFKKRVIDYFVAEYKAGRTPNPCAMCNKYIKFGILLDKALTMGFDYVATGHYVIKKELRIKNKELRKNTSQLPPSCTQGRLRLRRRSGATEVGGLGWGIDKQGCRLFEAKDKTRDQSYFLYTLTQEKLQRLIFPLGNYYKKDVWQLAAKFGLAIKKTESRGICFLDEANDVAKFLRQYFKFKSGPIKKIETGEVLGQHQGLQFYTIGQREAIGIGGSGPYYVIKLDLANNTLWVTNNPKSEHLFSYELIAQDVHWISGQAPKLLLKAKARIRYGHKAANCEISVCHRAPSLVLKRGRGNLKLCGSVKLEIATSSASTSFRLPPRNDNSTAGGKDNDLVLPLAEGEPEGVCHVKFSQPQRAITPGQIIVFYGARHEMLGGGIIK